MVLYIEERIRLVETKIEKSLQNEDFISVSALSIELDNLIREYTHAIQLESVQNYQLEKLQKISDRLSFFKEQTKELFKNYSSKISTQTKMHNAYKK